jgi:hypothetical protein
MAGLDVERPARDEIVHPVSDWDSGAAADFGWMREGPSRTGV